MNRNQGQHIIYVFILAILTRHLFSQEHTCQGFIRSVSTKLSTIWDTHILLEYV